MRLRCAGIVTGMLLLGGSAVINALTGMNIYAAAFLIPIGIIMCGPVLPSRTASASHAACLRILQPESESFHDAQHRSMVFKLNQLRSCTRVPPHIPAPAFHSLSFAFHLCIRIVQSAGNQASPFQLVCISCSWHKADSLPGHGLQPSAARTSSLWVTEACPITPISLLSPAGTQPSGA